MYYTEAEKNYLQDVLTDYLDIQKETEFILTVSTNPMIRAVALETLEDCSDDIDELKLAFAVGDLVPTVNQESDVEESPGMVTNYATAQSEIDTIIEKWQKSLKDKPGSMPGGRYPVNNAEDLDNAIRAVGRAKGGAAGRAAVRRHIISRARALGLSSKIPDTWNSDGTLKPGS